MMACDDIVADITIYRMWSVKCVRLAGSQSTSKTIFLMHTIHLITIWCAARPNSTSPLSSAPSIGHFGSFSGQCLAALICVKHYSLAAHDLSHTPRDCVVVDQRTNKQKNSNKNYDQIVATLYTMAADVGQTNPRYGNIMHTEIFT